MRSAIIIYTVLAAGFLFYLTLRAELAERRHPHAPGKRQIVFPGDKSSRSRLGKV